MQNIILASNSPRRKDILTKLNLKFKVVPSDYDEKIDTNIFSYKKIENIALNKALAVKKIIKNESEGFPIILSADTVVVLDNLILGKPQNIEHACIMLNNLSAKKHFVVTSTCAINTQNNKTEIISTTSYVTFNVLSQDMIKEYVTNFMPLDKAGSYGIQELPENFVNSIDGDFENIVGLSSQTVKEILLNIK